ncbi:hypothetical protein [Trebonia sp.]|uniref:hypothetical protein n=1 Tax=Trebonia sp. TaxID=2767075 RepID=UPI00262CC44F|nr:hypothetical protein [Trebonia sp.]
MKQTSTSDLIADQRKKAENWDLLLAMLKNPVIRDDAINNLRRLRLATLMLLAAREELPDALVTELRSYRARIDALFLEAVDGYRGDGHDMLPTYITEMIAAELSQENDDDDLW